MADVQINAAQILAALREPFSETNELLGREMQRQLTDPKWAWPTQPSPRDIVDTGRLRDSYQGTADGLEYEHAYPVRYALAVHNGAVMRNGSQPARPWVKQAVKEFDFAESYAQLAQARLDKL